MLFQLPAQHHLGAILAQGAIVSQDEVCVGAVEHGELAEGVGHGLVHSRDLRKHTAHITVARLGC